MEAIQSILDLSAITTSDGWGMIFEVKRFYSFVVRG